MNKTIWITAPEREEQTKLELKALGAKEALVLGPGIIQSTSVPDDSESLLPFVRDIAENARRLTAASVREVRDQLVEALAFLETDGEAPWRLHLIDSRLIGEGQSFSRSNLIYEGTLEWLQKKRRSWLRRLVQSELTPYQEGEYRVQLIFSADEKSFLSVQRFAVRTSRHWSPAAGGFIRIPDRKDLPSRAYRKLFEGCALLGRRPTSQETCVDLGASPGGWTALALEWGANVIAIDRSPLDAAVMKHKKLAFQTGNALTFTPQTPVDWLLCDVITVPAKSIGIAEHWLEKRICKHLCVTLKFKGEIDSTTIKAAGDVLRKHCTVWKVKQLMSNKNEVALLGSVGSNNPGND